ncbi:MAG: hypothetical protein HQL69_24145 [Magnetococcales bacterium]|nr:hypothetical protein [Magnetococcales bacterium]
MSTLLATKTWISGLHDGVEQFMEQLQVPSQPGRFLPCSTGYTKAGENAALGFSCFALKIYYTLGLWDKLPESDKTEWLDLIRSYQILDPTSKDHSSFVDPQLLAGIEPHPKLGIRVGMRSWLKGVVKRDWPSEAVKAETKQAIATLAQVGATPIQPYYQFPHSRSALLKRLKKFKWQLPWLAGGQTAGIAVFIQSQGPLLESVDEKRLIREASLFLDDMADPTSGTYFRGKPPNHGQLVNGAMKVLNALDWLNAPIHYPEQLIDTCLIQGPSSDGCHVVDWVYVVHRCLLQTKHRLTEIQEQCLEIAKMIKNHQNSGMGFSYKQGKAQTNYYGAKITKGLDEGDIHGTCLLVWAISILVDILEIDEPNWNIIRP